MNDAMTLAAGIGGGMGGRRNNPSSSGSSTFDPNDISAPTDFSGGNDIWSELMNEYGKVDSNFDTSKFDTAAENEYGNITTQAEKGATSAAAEYTARARQSGGSAEGAGLVKAEAQVAGRSTVADYRLKQMQYDIAQKEAGANLAADISSKLGSLRLGYLQNLTGFKEAQLQSRTQMTISDRENAIRLQLGQMQQGTSAAALAEQAREFGWLHPYQRQNTAAMGYGQTGWGGINTTPGGPEGMSSSDPTWIHW